MSSDGQGSQENSIHEIDCPEKIRFFEMLYERSTGGWRMPPWLDKDNAFSPEKVEEWSLQCPIWFSPVEREVAWFYESFIKLVGARTVLETGTNAGYSTARIACGLRYNGNDSIVYTFDIGPAEHIFLGTELEKYVKFIQGSSLEAEFDNTIELDLMILDSDHTYDTIIKEIIRFEPQLKVGGTMLLHDSIYFDGVGHAVIQLMKSDRFEVITLPTPRDNGIGSRRPGLTIVRKVKAQINGSDLRFEQEWSGIEIGRDQMKTSSIIDIIYHKAPDF